MQFVLIGTEGNVSEPSYIEALKVHLSGQQPRNGSFYVEVMTIPLGGNQGHRRLIEKADERMDELSRNQESLLHCAISEGDADIEKWLVCDFDQMDERGIDPTTFRADAESAGYHVIINKPNFEYFILSLLIGDQAASQVPSMNYASAINMEVTKLNQYNIASKNFSETMSIPKYSKKTYAARNFFGPLVHHNPQLLDNLPSSQLIDHTALQYTDMPVLIERLRQIYS